MKYVLHYHVLGTWISRLFKSLDDLESWVAVVEDDGIALEYEIERVQ